MYIYRFCQICDLNNYKKNNTSWICSKLCNNHKRIIMHTLIFTWQHQFTYNNTTPNSWKIDISNVYFEQTIWLASSNQNIYCLCDAMLLFGFLELINIFRNGCNNILYSYAKVMDEHVEISHLAAIMMEASITILIWCNR